MKNLHNTSRMNRRQFLGFAGTAVAGLALVACGGGGDATDDAGSGGGGGQDQVVVTMHDMYFGDTNDNQANPPVWTVTSGNRVTVNMTNEGALDHTWAVMVLGSTIPDAIGGPEDVADITLFSSDSVFAGESDAFQFTAPAAGEYVVVCTIAGHYPMMQGRLQVN